MRLIPETANRADWPRLVAQAVKALVNSDGAQAASIAELETDVASAQTDIATAGTDITALQTRATTAEADIVALEAANDWAAYPDFADDAAAAAGGVQVGGKYRTGSIPKVRIS